MIGINFIAVTETINRVENEQVVSQKIHSRFSKISKITYLDIDKSDLERFNRRSKIQLDLFTAGKYPSGEIVAAKPYHRRIFNFETMVPTTHSHLLNFRYKDDSLYQYFTVVDRTTNQIVEAGFIERDMFGLGIGANIVIDSPDSSHDQRILYREVNLV